MQINNYDAIVVGGGLSGLAAGLMLARQGRRVALFDKSGKAGGRAGTKQMEGGSFNLGPHALYNSGLAAQILKELGIHWTGKKVKLNGKGKAIMKGRLLMLPDSPLDILTSRMLSIAGKGEVIKFFVRALRTDPHSVESVSQSDWVNQFARNRESRDLINAFFRVATYTNVPDLNSAGLAIGQFQKAIRAGVTYLDGGWQSLVNRLRESAIAAGLHISLHSRVLSLEHSDGRVRGVRTYDEKLWESDNVVLACSSSETTEILHNSGVPFKYTGIPVRVACLDLLLKELPDESTLFALGIDAPLYFSVHSRWAKLTQNGEELVHVMKYLAPGEDGDLAEEELEGLMDLVQPGWRKVLKYRRFVPTLIAVSAIAQAHSGGLKGRIPIDAANIEGVYLCGDWIGTEGWLADGSLASAKAAANAVLSTHKRPYGAPTLAGITERRL